MPCILSFFLNESLVLHKKKKMHVDDLELLKDKCFLNCVSLGTGLLLHLFTIIFLG